MFVVLILSIFLFTRFNKTTVGHTLKDYEMTTVQTENGTQVCFVNTHQQPVKIERQGYFSYSKSDKKEHVFELCKVFYPHPDAPEHSYVYVLQFVECEIPIGIGPSIEFVEKSMKGFGSVVSLNHPVDQKNEAGEL